MKLNCSQFRNVFLYYLFHVSWSFVGENKLVGLLDIYQESLRKLLGYMNLIPFKYLTSSQNKWVLLLQTFETNCWVFVKQQKITHFWGQINGSETAAYFLVLNEE